MTHVSRKIFLVMIGAGVIGLVILVFQVITGSSEDVRSEYKRRLPVVDPERRTERIGEALEESRRRNKTKPWESQHTEPLVEAPDKSLDLTALAGMPDDYRRIVVEYVESALDELHTAPLMRKRYYHVHRPRVNYGAKFPDDANPIFDRKVRVSPVVLPRPEAVCKWVKSTHARKAGWRAMDDALSDPGTVYGHTLIFEEGERSEPRYGLPASPMGTFIPSMDNYSPELSSSVPFFGQMGKIVLQPMFYGANDALSDASSKLHLGEVGGATLLGELLTVPLHLENQRLRWASRQVGSRTEQFLAYSLIDGNGARQIPMDEEFQMLDLGEVSPYLRPLNCEGHQPRINQHDLLLLPVPLGWAPSSREEVRTQNPHEEWSFDDWFPAQQDACWVIRETAESSPLKEAFVLMPAREESELSVFVIVMFAETEPAQLVRELASLYKVSAESLLTSEEKMGHLRHLYEKVSTFRFD